MGEIDGVEALSEGLRPVYEAIRRLLAGVARDEARSRYQVGVLIAQVKAARDKYGAHAVERLARALGTNVHSLYRCANVVRCWSPAQLEVLLRRTTAHGQPLSWSHLVLLAGVPSEHRRAELVDRSLQDALTVRELLVLVDAAGKGHDREGGALVVLRRVVRSAERWSAAAAVFHDELLAVLEGVASDAGEPALLIERAIAAQEQLHGILQKQLARLRAEKGRFEPTQTKGARAERDGGVLLAGTRIR
jgi:hypothetical protein